MPSRRDISAEAEISAFFSLSLFPSPIFRWPLYASESIAAKNVDEINKLLKVGLWSAAAKW